MSFLPGQVLSIIEQLIANPLLVIVGLIVLVLLGLLVIVIIGTLILILPALIVASIVWWLTGSEILAGFAFLLIALLAFARR
jgi:hypothetical protein